MKNEFDSSGSFSFSFFLLIKDERIKVPQSAGSWSIWCYLILTRHGTAHVGSARALHLPLPILWLCPMPSTSCCLVYISHRLGPRQIKTSRGWRRVGREEKSELVYLCAGEFIISLSLSCVFLLLYITAGTANHASGQLFVSQKTDKTTTDDVSSIFSPHSFYESLWSYLFSGCETFVAADLLPTPHLSTQERTNEKVTWWKSFFFSWERKGGNLFPFGEDQKKLRKESSKHFLFPSEQMCCWESVSDRKKRGKKPVGVDALVGCRAKESRRRMKRISPRWVYVTVGINQKDV